MNTLIILVYSSMMAINAIFMVSAIIKKEKISFDYLYVVLCLLILGWCACEIVVHAPISAWWATYLYTAKLAFVAFIPVVFFLLVSQFYNMRDRIPRRVIVILLVFASITAALALTCMHHDLLRSTQEIVATHPLTVVQTTPGLWYYVNAVVCQVPVIAMAGIVLSRRKKLPAAYRAVVTLLMVALSVYILGLITFISGIAQPSGLDPNLISVSLVNYLFFTAVSSNGRADYLNVWRRDVFDYLDEAVLIVNDSGLIADANEPAKRLFSSMGLSVIGLAADELEERAAATGKASFRQLEDEHRVVYGNDMYVSDGRFPVVYSMSRQAIQNTDQAGEGHYIFFSEVTLNRLYIERLRDSVGVDVLTGLSNRHGYERVLAEWDVPENLPLSIIIGDVNGLKILNDSHGHELGDTLLKQVAQALHTSCPEEGFTARIGGDEFAVVLKRHTEQDAARVIYNIQTASLNIIEAAPSDMPIALGFATKNRPEENINALIMQADATMYLDKKAGGETL